MIGGKVPEEEPAGFSPEAQRLLGIAADGLFWALAVIVPPFMHPALRKLGGMFVSWADAL